MLVLLRHGKTEANAAGLLLGRAESPLTKSGRVDAQSLSRMLGNVERLITSPLGRARDSAECLGLDLEAEVDERWIEVDYGSYDEEKLGDVPAEVWRAWRADATFRPPGGESLAEMGERVRIACEELFADVEGPARSPHRDVVVVSHVSPIKAAVAWALGADDGLAWRLQLATASMTVIGWGAGHPVLHRYNVTATT